MPHPTAGSQPRTSPSPASTCSTTAAACSPPPNSVLAAPPDPQLKPVLLFTNRPK
jgi:hypothetical protein